MSPSYICILIFIASWDRVRSFLDFSSSWCNQLMYTIMISFHFPVFAVLTFNPLRCLVGIKQRNHSQRTVFMR